jgi:hypothetical protein
VDKESKVQWAYFVSLITDRTPANEVALDIISQMKKLLGGVDLLSCSTSMPISLTMTPTKTLTLTVQMILAPNLPVTCRGQAFTPNDKSIMHFK